jgi:hypothetical protein
MINQGYIEGVGVTNVYPYHYENDVDVSQKINIKVNTALKKSSIFNSIKLIDATDFSENDLKNNFLDIFQNKEGIDCIISFLTEKNTIIVQPSNYLEKDKKYSVLVFGLISSFDKKQKDPFYSIFFTKSIKTLHPTELLFPNDNSVLDVVPEFKWIEQSTTEYIFEMSKDSSFVDLIYQQNISQKDQNVFDETIQFTPSIILDENDYFWRVRSVNGNWSKTYCFYFKPHEIVPVTNEDEIFKDAAIDEIINESIIKKVETKYDIDDILFNPFINTIVLNFNFIIEENEIKELIFYSDDDHLPDFEYTIINDSIKKTGMIVISLKELGGIK